MVILNLYILQNALLVIDLLKYTRVVIIYIAKHESYLTEIRITYRMTNTFGSIPTIKHTS